jgi:hypothetical protein
MKTEALALVALFVLTTSCGKKEAAKVSLTNNSSGNPITAPVDYLGAVAKGKKFAEKQIDLAQLKQAIQFFQANEDRLPKSLDEMISKHYLGQIPKAPYGMQIVYDPATGNVKVVNKQ